MHGLPPQTTVPEEKVKINRVKTKYKNPMRSSEEYKIFHVKEEKK